ncbi:hypothetical protein VIGAN_01456900 [Vigna angularis var. angularis]|uniref:Uncharacterized protein n=1 Tax=Vigna angularis var. angularis TaxID=157739 RepID=A0A0S3R7B2_PHAAN|nr:hypothetical protein VIGAN_01456900 [Vigna angularis var. angularis]
MDPISTGIPPVNLLLERFRMLKFLQLATPLGASPTNPFCERSSSSRLQFKGKASKGIVPLRWFSATENILSLANFIHKLPLRLLVLKSKYCSLRHLSKQFSILPVKLLLPETFRVTKLSQMAGKFNPISPKNLLFDKSSVCKLVNPVKFSSPSRILCDRLRCTSL